jgi:DNA-binding NarL/FixJ family response regulator
VPNPLDTVIRRVGVVVVDDHAPFREAAGAVVAATPEFILLGEAACGEDGVSLATRVHPDLMVVDVQMPGISGFETTARLGRLRPRPFVVLVSADDDSHLSELALAYGAIGFLPKGTVRPSTLRALWARRDGGDGRDGGGLQPERTIGSARQRLDDATSVSPGMAYR